MAKINITEDYCVVGEKHQWVLARRDVGNGVSHECFFSTFEDCVNELLQRKIRLSNAQSINGLIRYTKSLVTACNKALQPLQIRIEKAELPEISQKGGGK
jgi:hypothetical protein